MTAPADAPDPERDSFTASLEVLQGSLDDMTVMWNNFADRANRMPAIPGRPTAASPPPVSADPALLEGARQAVQDIIDRGREIANRANSVVALFAVSRRWSNDLRGTVSGLVADRRGQDNASKYLVLWDGPAATQYTNVLIKQQAAVNALGAMTGKISQWLSDIAVANVTFMADTSTAYAEHATRLATTAATALNSLNVFGIAASIIDIAGQLGARQATINSNAARHLAGSLGFATEADNIVNDNNSFPYGGWPNPVAR